VTENNGAGRGVIDTIAHTIEANTSRRAFGDPLTFGDVTDEGVAAAGAATPGPAPKRARRARARAAG